MSIMLHLGTNEIDIMLMCAHAAETGGHLLLTGVRRTQQLTF